MIQGRLSKIAIKTFFFSALLSNFFCCAVGPVSYATVGDKLISSYGIINKDGKRGQTTLDGLGIPHLSEQDQRKLVFSLLTSRDLDTDDDESDEEAELVYQASHTLMDDLEIFYVKGKSDQHINHLFSKFNNTTTSFGEAFLAKMLVSPVGDSALLRKRQALIKELYSDEKLFNQLSDLVFRMKKAEPALLSLWIDNDPTTKAIIKSLYFSSHLTKKYNTDPAMLGVRTGFNYIAMAQPLYWDILLGAFGYWAQGWANQGATNKGSLSIADSFIKAVKAIYWPNDDMRHFYTAWNLNMADPQDQAKFKSILVEMEYKEIGEDLGASNQSFILKGLGLRMFGKAVWLYQKYQGVQGYIEAVKRVQEVIKRLQVKLIGVAAYVDSFKRIDAIMQRNETLKDGLLCYNALHNIFDAEQPKSKKFKKAVTLLGAPTFKGEASNFSHTGNILSAYGLVCDTKADLIAPLEAIGELDACLSVVKLMKKFEHERVGFSFVQFVDGDKPYIKLEGFWNPQIDPAVVVPNSLELGGPATARNVILTGSNTGGKSTLLKGITMSLLMAHAWGIVPGREAIMTHFTFLGTSLNIVDNTADGDSLYMAEVNRFKFMHDAVATLHQAGKKCFLIIDELFRGTGPEKADLKTYESAKQLNAFDNAVYILATHFFNNPLKLEQESKGLCQNYKMDAYIDSNNTIVRPFILEKGVCKNNIADDIINGAMGSNNQSK